MRAVHGSVGVWVACVSSARDHDLAVSGVPQLSATCLTRTSAAHDGHVTAVALCPALQPLPYAATGGEDCLVRLWYRPLQAVTGDALGAAARVATDVQVTQSKGMRLRGHNAPITAVHLDTFKIVSTRCVLHPRPPSRRCPDDATHTPLVCCL